MTIQLSLFWSTWRRNRGRQMPRSCTSESQDSVGRAAPACVPAARTSTDANGSSDSIRVLGLLRRPPTRSWSWRWSSDPEFRGVSRTAASRPGPYTSSIRWPSGPWAGEPLAPATGPYVSVALAGGDILRLTGLQQRQPPGAGSRAVSRACRQYDDSTQSSGWLTGR